MAVGLATCFDRVLGRTVQRILSVTFGAGDELRSMAPGSTSYLFAVVCVLGCKSGSRGKEMDIGDTGYVMTVTGDKPEVTKDGDAWLVNQDRGFDGARFQYDTKGIPDAEQLEEDKKECVLGKGLYTKPGSPMVTPIAGGVLLSCELGAKEAGDHRTYDQWAWFPAAGGKTLVCSADTIAADEGCASVRKK